MNEKRVYPESLEPDSAPPPGGSRRSRLLTLLMAVAAIGLVAVVTSRLDDSTGTTEELEEPPSVVGEVNVPEVVGMRFGEAVGSLEASGFSVADGTLVARWVANDGVDAGVVVAQSPPAGALTEEVVELEVSAGGPTMLWPQLPPFLWDLMRDVPDYDITEPILHVETPTGLAYKVDRFLFGTCDAVDQASAMVLDTDFEVICVEPSVTVSGVLPDGTRYMVSGLPPGDYPPEGLGGVVMIDLSDGTSQALGVISYAFLNEPAETSVDYSEGRLVAGAGRWVMIINVYPHVLETLDFDEVDRLPESIRPHSEGEYLILDLDPPLRFQRPWEIPAVLSVHHPGFQVAMGCADNPEMVTYCDPSSELSVRPTVDWMEAFPLQIRQDTSDLEHRATIAFSDCMKANGITVQDVSFEIARARLVDFNSVYSGQDDPQTDNIHNACIRQVIEDLGLEAWLP